MTALAASMGYPHPRQCASFVERGECAEEATKGGICPGECETGMAGAEGTGDELHVLRRLTVIREQAKQTLTK